MRPLEVPLALLVGVALFLCTHGKTTVVKVRDGSIATYQDHVKLQNIPFDKRHINQSLPTSVEFNMANIQDISGISFKWYRNDQSINVQLHETTLPANPGNIFALLRKVELDSAIELHLKEKELISGNYTIVVSTKDDPSQSSSATAFVKAAPILPLFPKERRVLEGDRLNVYCTVLGYPIPTEVKWRFASIKPELMDDAAVLEDALGSLVTLNESSSAYRLDTNVVSNDTLFFESLPKDYNGLYECSVESPEGGDRTLILVNVKDRWAAFWPFIGIVVEVSILVTAILLYERHQMRSKPLKSEAPVGGGETSPSTKQRSNSITQQQQQQQQQPNLTVPVSDNVVDVAPDGTKVAVTDTGNAKQDDLRQRMGATRS